MTDDELTLDQPENILPITQHPSYLIFVLTVSMMSLALLGVETVIRLDSNTRQIIQYADEAVCVVFLMDFIVMFIKAENKVKYFITWGWLDLLSCVPTFDVFRWGRAARIMRIFRVLRGIKSARIISKIILERRSQSVFLAVVLVSIILVAVSAISILHFETTPDRTIKTPEDAAWWAMTTITTIGYGDKYPVTTEGRAVAIMLMIAGVGLFGTFSGFIASWFIEPTKSEKDHQIGILKQELREIRELLDEIKRGKNSS